jgi:hypothetical protein
MIALGKVRLALLSVLFGLTAMLLATQPVAAVGPHCGTQTGSFIENDPITGQGYPAAWPYCNPQQQSVQCVIGYLHFTWDCVNQNGAIVIANSHTDQTFCGCPTLRECCP